MLSIPQSYVARQLKIMNTSKYITELKPWRVKKML